MYVMCLKVIKKEKMPEHTLSIEALYFSPTGSTRKITRSFCGAVSRNASIEHDLTLPKNRTKTIPRIQADLLVLAFPIYEEKMPEHILHIVEQLKGEDTPAVILGVYGAVDYGVSLRQAQEILEDRGFHVVGAGAFIGEHSFASDSIPLAKGRPDVEDLNIAAEYGKKISRLLGNHVPKHQLVLPGSFTLQARVLPSGSIKFFAHPPLLDPAACNACGACVRVCPTGAVDPNTFLVDNDACIRCFACVKFCPRGARKKRYRNPWIVRPALSRHVRRRKEPELFFLQPSIQGGNN